MKKNMLEHKLSQYNEIFTSRAQPLGCYGTPSHSSIALVVVVYSQLKREASTTSDSLAPTDMAQSENFTP